jgi:multidrug efflux pump subunit AcrA (membrane-fusion protein)
MKPRYILLIAAIFLILSVFSWIKTSQVKRFASQKAELQTKFDFAQAEINRLATDNRSKSIDLSLLTAQKQALEKQLAQYKADTDKQIKDFKQTIWDLTKLPADTVYYLVFSKWPTFDQPLKFRFAENQIREIHLNILERDHYFTLSDKLNKSLSTCTALNIQNDKIILNLTDQNSNLNGIVANSEGQISNLTDQLKLSDKQLRKVKRNSWLWKGGTILAAAGWAGFILK